MSIGRRNEITRAKTDIERVRTKVQFEPPTLGVLGKITGATQYSPHPYQWVYDWVEAQPSVTHGLEVRANGLAGTALSISELGNNGTGYFSYGILGTNIPAGFTPRKIHTGAAVWLVPCRVSDAGTLRWLIINSQAIDGVCT